MGPRAGQGRPEFPALAPLGRCLLKAPARRTEAKPMDPGLLALGARALCVWCALGALACQSPSTHAAGEPQRPAVDLGVEPDLPVSRAPFEQVSANWKQRLEQPYVYFEERGNYTGIGRLLERTNRALMQSGLEASGPPFALYYDDPAKTSQADLRMRACFPVSGRVTPSAGLGFDMLEGTTVVYGFVSGPYPEVARAYPGLFAYLRELGWVESGPIRESYLVNPADVGSWDELICEVQIPATSRP